MQEIMVITDFGKNLFKSYHLNGSHCGLVANVLDWYIAVNGFESELHYYVHIKTNTFRKVMNLPVAIGWIESLLFFYKNSSSFRKFAKVIILLN